MDLQLKALKARALRRWAVINQSYIIPSNNFRFYIHLTIMILRIIILRIIVYKNSIHFKRSEITLAVVLFSESLRKPRHNAISDSWRNIWCLPNDLMNVEHITLFPPGWNENSIGTYTIWKQTRRAERMIVSALFAGQNSIGAKVEIRATPNGAARNTNRSIREKHGRRQSRPYIHDIQCPGMGKGEGKHGRKQGGLVWKERRE